LLFGNYGAEWNVAIVGYYLSIYLLVTCGLEAWVYDRSLAGVEGSNPPGA